MMKENIIAIRNVDSRLANEAFADLMGKTESALNDRSRIDRNLFKNISASELEKISCSVIKEMCAYTPFRAEEVRLISGAKFPDIMAEKYYGVEVKSTIKNHWTSTGSSIVESTRDEFVENIYMLFGKLGGEYAQFRCRPYQDVLCEIAVTHCPRYLINMELKEGNSIFDKMGTSYDKFRTSKDSISQVRQYYKSKALEQGKLEMPWWLGDGGGEDVPSAVTVRFWRDLTVAEKLRFQAQIFILFPEVLISKYDNASLWLCTTKGILNPHIRDTFTAGGRIRKAGGNVLDAGCPQIYKQITNCASEIKRYLSDNEFRSTQIKEFNPTLLLDGNPYQSWINQVIDISGNNTLAEWIDMEILLE
ncbi:MAG: hypothetical protein K2J65_01620 [Duncaniella sp.]|nr:hypothetical protein [Duncaniella sp.]